MSQPPPISPMPVAYEPRGHSRAVDEGHLSALSVCHYVWGGMLVLFSCFGLIYVALGVAMVNGQFGGPAQPMTVATTVPMATGNPPIDAWFGWFFVAFGCAFVLLGWTLAVCTILAGRAIAGRRRWTFAVVVAILNCLMFPIGTVLGVFTLVVLLRTSVQPLFTQPRPT